MTSAALAITRTLITLADAHALYSSLETPPADEETATIRRVSTLFQLSFLVLGLGETYADVNGASLGTLKVIKVTELFGRMGHWAARIAKLEKEGAQGIEMLEKGLIAPMADLIKVGNEMNAYVERGFLEKYEKDPTATRPIYEFNPDLGEDGEFEITGYRQIDPQECNDAIERSGESSALAAGVRLAAEVGALKKAIKLGPMVYDELASFFINRVYNNPNVVPVAEAERMQPVEGFSLVQLEEIPEPLHADEVFGKYVCPITLTPIRDPVQDPTTGEGVTVLYERAAITRALQRNLRSPWTQRELIPMQLIEVPALQMLINVRLRHHDQFFWEYVAQSPALREQLRNPPDPDLQANADRETPNLANAQEEV